MRSWHLALVAGLISALFALTNVEAATVTISIDGDSVTVPVQQGIKSNGRPIFFINSEEEPFEYETANGMVILGGALDPDPSITFGSVAFDFGLPSTFSYTFILPLAPTVSNPSLVSDSFSGSVTNGPNPQPDGGVTVTALAPPPLIPVDGDGITEMQVYTLSDDGGVTWKNVGLDVGVTEFVALPPSNSGVTAAYNEGPIPTIPHIPFGAWTHMRADVNFKLSGGGDIFTFNGAKTLAVPEPSTAFIALLCLATLGVGRPRSAR